MMPTQTPRSRIFNPNRTPTVYPPIYANRPLFTARDPFGMLPYLRIIRKEKRPLQWSNTHSGIIDWAWPVVDDARVPPSELNTVFRTHNCEAPCCLCASQSPDRDAQTPAAVFLVTTGRLAGEYVAACASSRCKYWCFLERFYPRNGLVVRKVQPRDAADPFVPAVPAAPPSVEDSAEEADEIDIMLQEGAVSAPRRRPLEDITNTDRAARRARLAGEGGIPVTTDNLVRENPPRPPIPSTPFGFLMRLDSVRRGGGLSDADFVNIFTKCQECRKIFTRVAFRGHTCAHAPPTAVAPPVIDLSGDDD